MRAVVSIDDKGAVLVRDKDCQWKPHHNSSRLVRTHCIAKKLEPSPFTSQHTGGDGTAMNTNTKSKVCGVRAQ